MLNLSRNIIGNFIIITLVIVLFGGCKKEESLPFENTSDAFTTEPELSFVIAFFDESNGEAIGIRDLQSIDALITGKDATKITSYEGLPTTNFKSDKGLLTISSSKIGSNEDPLDINIIAKLDGYISSNKRVKSFEKGQEVIKIEMVKIPINKKVSVKSDNLMTVPSNGITSSSFSLSTNINENISKTASSFFILDGTSIKDNSGKSLTGTLKSTLVHYDAKETNSLIAFPGGLVTNAIGKDAVNRYGTFTTAGFFNLEITDGSKNEAKSLSKACYVQTFVPDGIINPITNAPIKNLDKIDVWGYDKESGIWKYIQNVELQKSESNTFEVVFYPEQLSYFNLGWFKPIDPCGSAPIITINSPEMKVAEYLDFEISFKSNGLLFRKISTRINDGSQLPIYQAAPEDLEIKVANKNADYTGSLTFNGCSGSYILSLTKKVSGITKNTVTADISGYCARNPSVIIKPSGIMYLYNEADYSNGKFIRIEKGQTTIPNLVVGSTYSGYFYYKGKYHFRSFKVESGKTNYNLSGEILNGCN